MTCLEPALSDLNIGTPETLMQLLARLCGQPVGLICESSSQSRCGSCGTCRNYLALRDLSGSVEWNVATLNQALLLLNQPPISEDFFALLFGSRATREDLKNGVVRFRALAMLCFGNFRFAFKKLCRLGSDELKRELKPYLDDAARLREAFASRPLSNPSLKPIDPGRRWYLGYLSGARLHRDFASLRALSCHAGRSSPEEIRSALTTTAAGQHLSLFEARLKDLDQIERRDLEKLSARLTDTEEQLRSIEQDLTTQQSLGLENTTAYLTADPIDVYVATSMRESWEYKATARVIDLVFQGTAQHLRYFDPTLAFSRDRIDKGLIEGLMLKRASLTLYMVQETDTLGKDSELAATLAQGKPVVAYVADMDEEEIAREFRTSPLRFVVKRAMLLMAEDRFRGNELQVVAQFLEKMAAFSPVFVLVGDEEEEFLRENSTLYDQALPIIAAAESAYLDKRATDLRQNHPLALQVHLETGVANGVLVVRNERECRELILALLTNEGDFTLEHEGGSTVLRERISQSPFRVVTDDPTLTNSFWSFYLPSGSS